MNKVFAVGIGPGSAEFLTQQARAALEEAGLLCGYTTSGTCSRTSRGTRRP